MGIRGIKADFFGGDGQPVISFYHDLLVESAPYGLLMNFHGTTLPRGWQRTYPNLMTAEAIRGFEFITFKQEDADKAPNHCAMLPFTRNVFDPMDFTPLCLDRINNRVKRRTTSAFELALSVVFTSGLQHYVEIPAGMAKMPDYVKDFLRQVPAVWDDSKFIDGYPGKYAVLARKGEGRWHVAGINGEASEKTLTLDLSSVPGVTTGHLITDGEAGALFTQTPVTLGADRMLTVKLKPNGGFVLVLDSTAKK
jgi:alpha-glucosidase